MHDALVFPYGNGTVSLQLFAIEEEARGQWIAEVNVVRKGPRGHPGARVRIRSSGMQGRSRTDLDGVSRLELRTVECVLNLERRGGEVGDQRLHGEPALIAVHEHELVRPDRTAGRHTELSRIGAEFIQLEW